MTDPVAPNDGDEDSAAGTPGSRLRAWLVALFAVVIALVLFMHVFAPTIALEDESPPNHPQSLCVGCHIVIASQGK